MGTATSPPESIEIISYYRDACDLCDKMHHELASFIAGPGAKFDLIVTMRDIEDDPGWYRRFHEYVPVLVVNEQEVCHYFLDSNELLEALSKQ